jgi:hypothetical protein
MISLRRRDEKAYGEDEQELFQRSIPEKVA